MTVSERPAAQLLVWCARRFVRGDGGANGPPPPIAGLDDDEWRFFIRETLRHSCLPIAARTLATVDAIPPTIKHDLNTAFEANARRNLRLAGELVLATRALAEAGVTSVSWKGPLLAERAYGDLRLRQFFDLDLLIRRADLGVAA
ncbi:MAG TPA: nucleotidyltransferase family protein, partial [Candidatus Limnocylindrales bacterium]